LEAVAKIGTRSIYIRFSFAEMQLQLSLQRLIIQQPESNATLVATAIP
jgi:hypothetical protein